MTIADRRVSTNPAGRPGPVDRRTVVEVVDGVPSSRPDQIVTEEPLEIRLGWPGHPPARVAVTMRTPGADFELAAGYLLADGVTAVAEPPHAVAYCLDRTLTRQQQYNVVTVTLDHPPMRLPSRRATSMSSACGVCGVESLDDVFAPDGRPIEVSGEVTAEVVSGLPDALRAAQPLFAKTGSIHAAGVFDLSGVRVVTREDIGRHNTVDKVLGARQLGRVAFDEASVLCVSGRVGFDIVSKAVAGRIAVLVAVGGPSSLAVQLAERAGVTVCGFTRGRRFVVYTHPDRIRGV
jgi:FdhD protein